MSFARHRPSLDVGAAGMARLPLADGSGKSPGKEGQSCCPPAGCMSFSSVSLGRQRRGALPRISRGTMAASENA